MYIKVVKVTVTKIMRLFSYCIIIKRLPSLYRIKIFHVKAEGKFIYRTEGLALYQVYQTGAYINILTFSCLL